MSTFTAFYDLEHGPVSFDFATFLVRAMFEAGGAPLHVVIVPKEGGLAGFSRNWGRHDAAATVWRLWHVVVALCPLARATATFAASRTHADLLKVGTYWWPEGKSHLMGPLVDAAKRGEGIPRLAATDAAKRYVAATYRDYGEKTVTVTLRNQTTDPDRNTDPVVWRAFAAWLAFSGYRVVTLEEANDALSNGRGFAEVDPDLRLAIYERAAMNVIGNNGPQELLKFSCAPYLAVGQAPSDGWRDHFRRYFHLEPGEQLPWAAANQRLAYGAVTFESLKNEFLAMGV